MRKDKLQVSISEVTKEKVVRKISYKRKRALEGGLYILPWIFGFIVFFLYPLGRTIYNSFNKVTYNAKAGGYQYTMIWFKNYKRILTEEPDLAIAFQDFFVQILTYVPVIIALSIIIALLLNNKMKGRAIYRLIFFLPIIILNGQLLENLNTYGGMSLEVGGFVITVIEKISPEFLVDTVTLLFNTILQVLWYCGVPILIFLATIQKIDKSLFEAASIDGASSWNIFWKITLPTIYPLVSVVIVYLVVFMANIDSTADNSINNIINLSRYNPARYEGYASAQAVLFALLQVVLIAVLYFLTHGKKRGGNK
ncbi:MAG: transporter permease [Haloplasmataceae bacterium]|jgi:ABC-type sugar transport system permease subunit|nr:transporter permease [Haloplasmataceae bacterium]